MEALSPRRRELIRVVLEDPRAYVLLSVRDAAAKLSTDPATLVRLVQRMGFANYRAFQNYLHDLSIANATVLDGMQSPAVTIDMEENFERHVQLSTEQDVRNLNAVRTGLDTDRLKKLAKRIHQAKRRVILGGDLAECLVTYLEYQLATIGLPCITASSVGRSVHISQSAEKGDLFFAISFRKGLRQTVEGMQRAKERGAYCVGITGTYVSALARMADEFFVAPVESLSFIDSYTAPMGLLNQILVATANYKRGSSMDVLRKVAEEQRSGYRWYETE
ncbi:MAG: MurR/RpiR family transcriptional regulator [Acidobacteriaceae bacterium]|nr:MurR/RpiR family transcriptional regulator [Acidobacteriaceae bacterium]